MHLHSRSRSDIRCTEKRSNMSAASDGQPGRKLHDHWRAVDTCAISDALDRLGHPGVVPGVVALFGSFRLLGRAVTVELGPAVPEIASRHLGTAAVEAATTGDVIVVANRGRIDCAGWGGNLSLAAHLAGLSGFG